MATADTTKVVEADDAVSAPVRALQIGRDYGIGGFFFLLLLIFSLASPTFLSGPNLLGILTAASVVSLFALAEALVVIAGAIDLSVVPIAALVGVIVALSLNAGIPVWLAVLIGLGVGFLCGLLNASVIEFMNMSSLIATLATLTTLTGVVLLITNGKPIFGVTALAPLGQGRTLGVQNPILVMIATYALVGIVMSQTKFGNRLLAVGGNAEAARRAGVRRRFYVFAPFVACGVISAGAGIVVLGRLGSAQPTFANSILFDAITAVALAGVLLSGGRGSILKVLLGSLIVATIANGLVLLRVSSFWTYVTTGLLLAVAVWADGAVSRAIERTSLSTEHRKEAARA